MVEGSTQRPTPFCAHKLRLATDPRRATSRAENSKAANAARPTAAARLAFGNEDAVGAVTRATVPDIR